MIKTFFSNIAKFITRLRGFFTSSAPCLSGLIICCLLFVICYLVFARRSGLTEYPETIVMHDTTTLIRYETKLQHDTVIKWYEKVIYKESKPTYIYYQTVDTVFLKSIKGYDFMLRVQKDGDKLYITAVNLDGHIIKEYIYDDVSDNFTAVSKDSAIYVKSKFFEYEGISLCTQLMFPPEDHRFSVVPGLSSNFKLFNKVSLMPFAGYDFRLSTFDFRLLISLKLF